MKLLVKIILLAYALMPHSVSAWVAADIAPHLKTHPFLAQSSGAELFTVAQGQYIVLAHGVAPYKGDYEKSSKMAQADALTQISKLLGSTEVSTLNLNQASDHVQRRISLDQIDTSILMKSTSTRGYWIEGDSFHLISCLYLNTPMPAVQGDLADEFESIELSPAWSQVLASRRDLWLGGVGIVTHPDDGKHYLICLIGAKKSLASHQTELVLKTKASRELAKYSKGLSFKAQSLLRKEMKQVSVGDKDELRFTEQFSNKSSEKIRGNAPGLNKVGSLQHKISKSHFALFAQELDDIK